jgi:MYXO-CTERM domain-containing protein
VKSTSAFALALGCGLGLFMLPMLAAAAPPAVDRFDNLEMRQLAGFDDVGYDTGWLPAGSPVQLRIEFQAANTVQVGMFGEGHYDWEEQFISFDGDEEGGDFRYEVGLLIHAEVQANVVGFTWGSDLLGPFDYIIEDETSFDPYLLLGNADRPAVVSDAADGATIASIPLLPDILIASGNLDIDLMYEVEAQLQTNSILAEGPLDMVSVVVEDEELPLTPDEVADWTEPYAVEATLMAQLDTQTTVIIRPHLVMEILGTPYEIAGIDIPVELPEMSDEWVFDPVTLEFDRPEPPDAGDEGEGEGEDGEDGGSGSTDEGAFNEGGGDDGCNCRAHTGGSPLPLSLLLLALLPLRRRRRG